MTSRFALLLGVCLTGSGCSFASAYGPVPSATPRIGVSCTDERYAPAIDLGAAAGSVIDAVAANNNNGLRVAGFVGVLGFGASAIYGYMVTRDCMEAKNAAYRYHTRMLQKQYDVLDEFTAQSTPSDAPTVSAAPQSSPTPSPAPLPTLPPEVPTPAPPAQ